MADHSGLRDAIRRGEEAALNTLIDQYWAPVVRFVRSILGDADQAEDIAQETFVRFWATRDRLRGDGSLEPLLFRIARNASLDERKRGRFVRPLHEESLPPVPEYLQPDATVELRDLEVAVNRAIATIDATKLQEPDSDAPRDR